MSERLLEILKLCKIYPESGFGEIIIKIQDGKISVTRVTESKKIEG